jgi:acetyltransferase-like isoleucine patch superfamily enzyme
MRKIKLYLSTLIGYFLVKIIFKRQIYCQGKILLSGKPTIFIKKSCKLILGENVVLNSNYTTYHAFMHSSVKILIDNSNSIISIGNNTRLNGCCLHSSKSISIGSNCLIAAGTQIIDSNGHETLLDNPINRINSRDIPKEIIIGDNVWIGLNCLILPGSKIGNGSVIAAGSIVKSEIPPNSLVSSPGSVIVKSITN